MVSAAQGSQYLKAYVERYRSEYRRLIASPPLGGNYPDILKSTYLDSPDIQAYLASDGAVVADYSDEPTYQWEVAGGPALVIDHVESRTPPELVKLHESRRHQERRNLGLYRLVSKTAFDDDVWHGRLPAPLEVARLKMEGGPLIHVAVYDLSWAELIRRLTFGAFEKILNLHLPTEEDDFWIPHVVHQLGFVTSDRKNKRFFNRLELIRHIDDAAWDPRNLGARVYADIRRDYAEAATKINEGGYIVMPSDKRPIESFYDRLSELGKIIDRFASLLDERSEDDESAFHSFLRQNPVLLDLYGEAQSKPRWPFPPGESPLDKAYVEPDFVIKRPDDTYILLELERANKRLTTRTGRPTSDVTQPAFQISEWENYIAEHYHLLRDRYPGINIAKNRQTMIVMSRTSLMGPDSDQSQAQRRNLLRSTYEVDDILTYDDLLNRARQAFAQLAALAPSGRVFTK